MSSTLQAKLALHDRWMVRHDMETVQKIENECFDYPWSEEDFIRCLRLRNCIGMVFEHNGAIVGFMIYELHKSRLHVLSFAVKLNYRRRGVGQAMVNKLKGKLSSQRRTALMLEIRETNLGAQLFFQQQGFKAISVLRDFYDDTTEDAYLMRYVHDT